VHAARPFSYRACATAHKKTGAWLIFDEGKPAQAACGGASDFFPA